MKYKLPKLPTFLLALVILILTYCFMVAYARAQDATATSRWIDAVTVAPVGALKTAGITGPTQWGAGLDVGFNVNPFVGIHVVNLDFEGRDQWRGKLVDETSVLVKAKIARFSTESFSIYGLGGGQRDWNLQDWGFSAGLGAELSFLKNFSLSADYSLRAWFNHPKDSLAKAGLNISF